MGLLEIKLDKFRGKMNGEIDETKLKRVEMKRCNEYCFAAIRLFAHFTCLYAKASDAKFSVDSLASRTTSSTSTSNTSSSSAEWAIAAVSSEAALDQLAGYSCQDPDYALMAPDEVRPFLNAHFFTARMLSKVDGSPHRLILLLP